jgi:hypothetical protein
MLGEVELFISPWCGCYVPRRKRKIKILSAHNQIDAGNLLSSVYSVHTHPKPPFPTHLKPSQEAHLDQILLLKGIDFHSFTNVTSLLMILLT